MHKSNEEEKAAIGFWSAFSWLVGMTAAMAVLSEYVVGTIEASNIHIYEANQDISCTRFSDPC